MPRSIFSRKVPYIYILSLPDKHGLEITTKSAASQLVFKLIFLECTIQRGKHTEGPLQSQALVNAIRMFLLLLIQGHRELRTL